MTSRRGDIGLVPFSFSDLSASKKRPGLVSKTFARATPEFVVQILDRPCDRARSTETAA